MKLFLGYAFIIAIVVILLCMASCSTSKKSKSTTKIDSKEVVKIDSVSVKTVDSVSVKKDNTVTTVEKSVDYEKETTVEFEPTPSGTKAADYFPIIKRKIIKEKGFKKENITIVAGLYDSSRKISTNNTSLKKDTEKQVIITTTTKIKKTSGLSSWVWIGCLIILVIWAGGALLGLWSWLGWLWFLIGLFRRKKEEYPVRYHSDNYPNRLK